MDREFHNSNFSQQGLLPVFSLSSKVYFEIRNMEGNLYNTFFSPTGIALIGASKDPNKLGYAFARNLIESGFPGSLHFVNPHGGVLFNQTIYASVIDVPDPVDLAILLIPAPLVPGVLKSCGERGIRSAVIAAGGFREIGDVGAALEKECVQISESYGMHLIGPNCVGLIDTHLPMNATFLAPPGPESGDLALLSQSGAMCAAVIDWARGQGIGFSRLISLGNQADLNETDLLPSTAEDPHTKVITLYLEGFGNGKRFLEIAPQVTRQKPVVALKVGRSKSGQRAASSHTGSLAGQDHVINAAFRKSGVIRAKTTEELFDWARALAWCPLPQGNATAILTNAGGPGVTAADILEERDLFLTDLSAATCQKLRSILPSAASVNNPIDLLASATPEQYAISLKLLQEDPKVDNILVILVPPPLFDSELMFTPVIPLIKTSQKPVVVVLMGENNIQGALKLLRSAQIPEYRFPERAAAALGALVQRRLYLNRVDNSRPEFMDVNKDLVKKTLAEASLSQDAWLPIHLNEIILNAYAIPTPPQFLVQTRAEILNAARKLHLGQDGQAVVIKIASLDILHKSDTGGVILDIHDEKTLLEGFDKIYQNAQTTHPHADFQGVHIQSMISSGQEIILGAIQDPQFGPLLMFGSGGIEVEELKDISFGFAPLTLAEAEEMIDSTWAGRKLYGYRNIPPVDREKIIDILLRLSQLAVDFPELTDIEINPLRAIEDGAYALDVRIRYRKS